MYECVCTCGFRSRLFVVCIVGVDGGEWDFVGFGGSVGRCVRGYEELWRAFE